MRRDFPAQEFTVKRQLVGSFVQPQSNNRTPPTTLSANSKRPVLSAESRERRNGASRVRNGEPMTSTGKIRDMNDTCRRRQEFFPFWSRMISKIVTVRGLHSVGGLYDQKTRPHNGRSADVRSCPEFPVAWSWVFSIANTAGTLLRSRDSAERPRVALSWRTTCGWGSLLPLRLDE